MAKETDTVKAQNAVPFHAGKAWLVMIVSMFATVCYAVSMFKAVAIMVPVMNDYGLTVTQAGNLMNFVGVVALILALPAGMIMQKIGPRKLLIITLCFGILGNIIGALSTSYGMLLFSRMIEGLGYGCVVSIYPQFIAAWFPQEKRGLPNGISSLWVSIGMFFVLNMSNVLVNPAVPFSWKNDWWLAMICLIVGLILVILFAKMPPEGQSQLDTQAAAAGVEAKPSIAEGLKSPATWLLLLVFFMFGYVNSAYSSYYPTFLQQDLGLDLVAANSLSSFGTIGMFLGGIIGGILFNKIPNRKYATTMLIVAVLIAVAGLMQFNIKSVAMVAPFLLVLGFVFQMFPGLCYSMTPEAATNPATLPITLGAMGIGQNVAGVFGTLITSLFKDHFGTWQSVTIPIAILSVIGVVASIALIPVMKKKWAQIDAAKAAAA